MGCTVEELEVPRKMLAINMAPHNAPMPSGVVLHSENNSNNNDNSDKNDNSDNNNSNKT